LRWFEELFTADAWRRAIVFIVVTVLVGLIVMLSRLTLAKRR